MTKSDIGLIGLGVMGSSLARNIAGKNFRVSVYNRTLEKTKKFISEYGSLNLRGEETIKAFVESLSLPRKIIVMVNAGEPVDAVIDGLLPYLSPGDLIIDAGNSYFRDTQERYSRLKSKKIHYLGCGVSGGEEGALHGPSMMPGGDKKAYSLVRPIFESIAAKDFSGKPCITYIGDNGAGHYVKMVHNGIEYAIMEIMAEAYDILRSRYKLSSEQIADIFEKYNKGVLKSYLFEISVSVLRKKDDLRKGMLIDRILDTASQKGTGKWTALDSVERGYVVPSISAALFLRYISSDKNMRERLSAYYPLTKSAKSIPLSKFIPLLEKAIYAAILISYAQGYELINKAAADEKWSVDLGEISRIWEGGCIIRAKLLNFLHKAYKKSGKKPFSMLAIHEVVSAIRSSINPLRKVVAEAAVSGVPTFAFGNSLAYFESITSEKLPANFIQGLRDYFGAHTYERIDKKGAFHTNWNQ